MCNPDSRVVAAAVCAPVVLLQRLEGHFSSTCVLPYWSEALTVPLKHIAEHLQAHPVVSKLLAAQSGSEEFHLTQYDVGRGLFSHS